MSAVENAEHRIARLQAAVTHCGGPDKLGILLGWKSGAFIKQMLTGRRYVTEKTVAKIEELDGMTGWFDQATPAAARTPMLLNDEEVRVVEAFRLAVAAATEPPAQLARAVHKPDAATQRVNKELKKIKPSKAAPRTGTQ